MNAADKLYIIGELERATGYQFSDLRNMSNEKLEEMYWERVMNGKIAKGQRYATRKRVR